MVRYPTRPGEVITGVTKMLSSKSSFTKIFHLSIPEIEAFLSFVPMNFNPRVRWHLTKCRDCVAIARFMAAIECLAFESRSGREMYIRIREEFIERGFYRDDIRIRPSDDYQSIIREYLLVFGVVEASNIRKGRLVTVKLPEEVD